MYNNQQNVSFPQPMNPISGPPLIPPTTTNINTVPQVPKPPQPATNYAPTQRQDLGAKAASRGKRGVFYKDLKHIMYGFGDVKNPLPESVNMLEEIVQEYITGMTKKAVEVSQKRGKLQTEDFVFIIRKDRKKYARVKELLVMHEELKRARKAFEVEGEKIP